MAVTQNTYTGNGSTTLYSFTFPYLEEDEIKVSLNGTLTTAYTLANATTISFTTAPANGAAIRIYRQTDNTATKSTFFPGSAIRAQDLNTNFLQTLYVSQESDNEAASATATANTALTNANTAVSTANTASTNASAAVSTANTASANASAAVTTANAASSAANTAVSTANTASANATTAINTANSATTTANNAVTTANGAVSTANTALTNANSAVSTANTASTNASAAVSTANTASSNATSAVNTANTATTTANSAVNTANSAVSTANSAVTTANAAAAAVANAVLYTTVANVAAIPGSPANNAAVEVTNSTGIESFTPLSGLPAGFVGSSGLSVRLIYQTAGTTWTWIQYFPNDPENRYFKLSGGTITGPITVPQGTVSSPGVKFSGTGNDNTGVYSPGIDELGLVTNGVNRLSIDSAGAVSIPGTLGVTGAVTGTSTVSGSALIPTGSSVPTNGVYLPAANSVAISTGGSGRLFVDSSGNISIGQSSSALQSGGTGITVFGSTSSEIKFLNSTTGAASTDGTALVATTTDFTINNREVGALVFGTSNSNRLRIESTGALNFVGAGTAGVTQAVSFNGSAPVNSLVIDSSGRLGVGTSSPSTNLDIVVGSGTATQKIGSSAVTSGSYLNLHGSSANKTWFIANNYNIQGALEFTQSTANGGTTPSSSPALLISPTGSVAIGTQSPQGKLIVSNGGANGIEFFPDTDSGVNSTINSYNRSSSAFSALKINAAQHIFLTASSEAARIDSSKRLLVGTSSARQGVLFEIESTSGVASASVIRNSNNSAGPSILLAKTRSSSNGVSSFGKVSADDSLGGIEFYGADGAALINAASIYAYADGEFATGGDTTDGPGRLVFSTTSDGASFPTERMRIGQNGWTKVSNAGEYNSTSGAYHEFNSNVADWTIYSRNTNASPTGIRIKYSGAAPNGSNNEFIYCDDTSARRFVVKSDGGIDNYSANNANLSDRNAKKDISPAANTWDCIKEWEIVNYRYKDQPDDADLNLGVIAQQVAESCPEVITVFQEAKEATETEPAQEERLGVKEQQMYWMAIKALQEAQVRIEQLEARLTAAGID